MLGEIAELPKKLSADYLAQLSTRYEDEK